MGKTSRYKLEKARRAVRILPRKWHDHQTMLYRIGQSVYGTGWHGLAGSAKKETKDLIRKLKDEGTLWEKEGRYYIPTVVEIAQAKVRASET